MRLALMETLRNPHCLLHSVADQPGRLRADIIDDAIGNIQQAH